MIKIGMMIGERYEVLELIGTGGMSDVYRAKCHKLNRFVAMKVLKQEFSGNTEFVSKFRVEAQAAAGLMHPNIVNVYDVGEENGIYYIVMELVEGITLKRYIEKKARLSVKETISIAIQISMGIEAAHNNHIIHRDIKPQNIIISKEGKVKVTDFGIAKAATSNTITSNVMGSVHYTSPEQARGGFSDEKSDIYSLGITIFEMLTGRVPFNGETTVTIALKHIQEEMPSPRNYVPEIPISLEQIVMKCTQKSPDRRYQNMAEVIEDLKKSLISPDEDFVRIGDEQQAGITRAVSEEELQKIKKNRIADVSDNMVISAANQGGITTVEKATAEIRPVSTKPAKDETRVLPQAEVKERVMAQRSKVKKTTNEEEVTRPVRRRTSEQEIQKKSKSTQTAETSTQRPHAKKRVAKKPVKPTTKKQAVEQFEEEDSASDKIKSILIVLSAILIGCIVIYFAGLAIGIFGDDLPKTGSESTSSVIVPDVLGKSIADAQNLLNEQHLSCSIAYEPSSEYEANQVMKTVPAANTEVNAYSVVSITVSTGQDGVNVANVVGLTEAEATAALEKEGFTVVKNEESSKDVAKGLVISQTPGQGELISRGGTVTLTISKGRDVEQVQVPSLTGMTEEGAKETLLNAGLVCSSVSEEYNDEVAAGLVCYQSYTVGASVEPETGVDIKLSLGPELKYYNCNISVPQPEHYQGGSAQIVLRSNTDGTELFSTSTDSFPVPIVLTNIWGVSGGTVTVTYTVYVQQESVDEAGNPVVQNVPAQDVYQYEVYFE